MRKRIKIINVTGFTAAQIETGVNTALTKGWEFVQIVVVGSNVFVILQQTITK